MSSIKREPIFWMTTSERTAADSPERSRSRMVNGRRVIEKFPQHGHDGSSDYENKRRAPGRRYVMVVRHEGHTVALLLTNAAAHLTDGPYAQYQLRKARSLGWYPAGACPRARRLAGELTDDQVVSDEAKQGAPCAEGTHSMKHPCRHDLAEREARRKQWDADLAERMAPFEAAESKGAAEQRKINKELITDLATIVAAQAGAAARAEPVAVGGELAPVPAPRTESARGKRGDQARSSGEPDDK